jgi:hypothetical protein
MSTFKKAFLNLYKSPYSSNLLSLVNEIDKIEESGTKHDKRRRYHMTFKEEDMIFRMRRRRNMRRKFLYEEHITQLMTLVIRWNKLETQTRPWSKNNIRHNKNIACKFNASSKCNH